MNQVTKKQIVIDNTNFIFKTNFAGDPEKNGKFGSNDRRCCIVIPTRELADEIAATGIEVKQYDSEDKDTGEVTTTLFVQAKVSYRNRDGSLKSRQPSIYAVHNDGKPVLKTEETVGEIDKEHVLNVKVTINPWYYEVTGKTYAYVNVMYVVCDANEDPFAHEFWNTSVASDEEYEEED